MTEDILNKDGNEFKLKAHLIMALRKRELLDTYAALRTVNGGYIGVPVGDERLANQPDPIPRPQKPKAPVAEQKAEPKAAKPKKLRVRVYRANCDEQNRDLAIKVTANSANNRKVFLPGEEVWLSDTQVSILRDSVTENRIDIEPASGIYSAKDPEVAAKNQYPGMQIKRNPINGHLFAFRSIPNFIIETLETA